MRRGDRDRAAQAACGKGALQQSRIAAGHQPFEAVIDDIALYRVLVLASRGDHQMRQFREPLQGQLLARGRMVGAQYPAALISQQRLENSPSRPPPEAADGEVGAAGSEDLGD